MVGSMLIITSRQSIMKNHNDMEGGGVWWDRSMGTSRTALKIDAETAKNR